MSNPYNYGSFVSAGQHPGTSLTGPSGGTQPMAVVSTSGMGTYSTNQYTPQIQQNASWIGTNGTSGNTFGTSNQVQSQDVFSTAAPGTLFNMDAAIYNAASEMAKESPMSATSGYDPYWTGSSNFSSVATESFNEKVRNRNFRTARSGGYRKTVAPHWFSKEKRQGPPQPQLYCELCKLSCQGTDSYKAHLEGSKHKKKEEAAKREKEGGKKSGGLRCELCEVDCSGKEAYNAHIKGKAHQKTLKLHMKLGKEIPTNDPSITVKTVKTSNPGLTESTRSSGSSLVSKVYKGDAVQYITPKMNFVGGSTLQTTGEGLKETREGEEESAPAQAEPVPNPLPLIGEKYMPLTKVKNGTKESFICSLCNCDTTDEVGREAHLRGRRHALNYKQKVDPEYVIPSEAGKNEKRNHSKSSNGGSKKVRGERPRPPVLPTGRDAYIPPPMHYPPMYYPYGPPPIPHPYYAHGPPPAAYGPPLPQPPPEEYETEEAADVEISMEDKLMFKRHTELYPSEKESKAGELLADKIKEAIHFASDELAERDLLLYNPTAIEKRPNAEISEEKLKTELSSTTEAGEQTAEQKAIAEEEKKALIKLKHQERLKKTNWRKLIDKHRFISGIGTMLPAKYSFNFSGDNQVDMVIRCDCMPTREIMKDVKGSMAKFFHEKDFPAITEIHDNVIKVLAEAPNGAGDITGIVRFHYYLLPALLTRKKKLEEEIKKRQANEPAQTEKETCANEKVDDDDTATKAESNESPKSKQPSQSRRSPKNIDKLSLEQIEELLPEDKLSIDVCLQVITQHQRMRWFENQLGNRATEFANPIALILRDVVRRNAGFSKLNDWLVYYLSITTCFKPMPSPFKAFLWTVRRLASGCMYPICETLTDPVTQENLSQEFTNKQRKDIRVAAGKLLDDIQEGKLAKCLNVAPIETEEESKMLASRIRGDPEVKENGEKAEEPATTNGVAEKDVEMD